MHEISPVLAGRFDVADYTPAVSNINVASANTADTTVTSASDVSGTASTAYVDPRRYSQFDRTASHVADAPNFSFGDFLDMVNPLQHIPLVSSVYRAVTGDTINPVSRVAGDILYGGALGALSAVAGGVSAIGDAVSESQTGKDTTGVVLASLFGDDKAEATTQIASADAAAKDPVTATALTAQSAAPALAQTIPNTADQALTLANATTGSAVTPAPLTDVASAAPLMQAKAIPLNKQAYGGVLAPTNNIEDQNRIIALSEGSHAMRLGHTIYTNPLMNGPHPLPVAAPPAAPSATATAATTDTAASSPAATAANTAAPSTATSSSTAVAQRNPLPQNLIDDMIMMKAIGQYKGVASGSSSQLGSSIDLSN